MFNMTATDLPFRGSRKDLARAQQLRRSLARARTGPSGTLPDSMMNAMPGSSAFDDMFMPMLDRNMWRPHLMSRPSLNPMSHFDAQGPFDSPSRFEELDDPPLPRSMSSSDVGYGSRYAKDMPSLDRRRDFAGEGVSFAKAAAALAAALTQAVDFCGRLYKQFEDDTWNIALYADPKVIDYLWTAKLEWNGVPAIDYAKDPNLTASPGTVTYKITMQRLLAALSEMKRAGPPQLRYLEKSQSQLSPEEVKITMKKLGASFQGIVDFADSVRRDRDKVHALNKELISANNLLMDIKDLWMPPVKKDAQKARVEDEFEHWPNYRGE